MIRFNKGISDGQQIRSRIMENFTEDQLKMLHYNALRLDIEDNNERADIVKAICGPEFEELGTGTNRIALFKEGYCYKIAIDRRGYVDNWTEAKRSEDNIHMFIAKTYESNLLINVAEYVTVMSKEEYRSNGEQIKRLLAELTKGYIINDVGYNLKNFTNLGYRSNGDLVILDYGYMYPKIAKGDQTCPKCKGKLEYNSNYTGFICKNVACQTKYSITDIVQRMNTVFEDREDQILNNIQKMKLPNMNAINGQAINKNFN